MITFVISTIDDNQRNELSEIYVENKQIECGEKRKINKEMKLKLLMK